MLATMLIGLAMAAAPGCGATLDGVAAELERNYPGFEAMRQDREAARRYRYLRRVLAAEAKNADAAACGSLLAALAGYFQDERIVLMSETADVPATTTFADEPEVVAAPPLPTLAARWTPDKVEFRLRREGNLDPIEGLWRDETGRFAIVHDDAIPRGEYVAFRFDYGIRVGPGEILAFIRPADDGSYEVMYRDGDRWLRARATLARVEGVLTLPGRTWNRTTAASGNTDGASLFGKKERVEADAPAATELSRSIYLVEQGESLSGLPSSARGVIIDLRDGEFDAEALRKFLDKFKGRTVLLQDRRTRADAERFLAMLPDGDIVTMGERTRGELAADGYAEVNVGEGDYAILLRYPEKASAPATSVAPQVALSLPPAEWVGFALRWLQARED